NGYGLFAVEYRLMKPGAKTYPGAVYDVKAAVQFVRAKAAEFAIDPERIALMGDSAGAHLAALVAVAGEEAAFSGEFRNDPFVARAVVIPGAGHFWITEPHDPGTFGAHVGPKILLFLKTWL